jgi:hypothetical protein
LDFQKTEYNILEKYVYETAMFHINRLNIDYKNIIIEFGCSDNNKLFVTEYNNTYPVLSCMSYFENNSNPSIITNVNMDNYLYKEFDSQTSIVIMYPEPNKQITFDGKYFHGSLTKNKYILYINLWNNKPDNIKYYVGNNLMVDNSIIMSIHEDDNIKNTIVSKNIMNRKMFECLLYENDISAVTEFIKNKHSCKLIKECFDTATINTNNLTNFKPDASFNNRFVQRFKYDKLYTHFMCKFIINECEKHSLQFPASVDKILSIFCLVIESLSSIIDKIKYSYQLHKETTYDVKDLFIVKYDNQNTGLYNNDSVITFNILLSNSSDFEGGETYFEDGLHENNKQGDLLIYSSNAKRSQVKITKGTKYVLVGLLNINNKVISDSNICALSY